MAWRVVVCLVLVVLAGCGADYGMDQNGKVVKAGQLDDQWLVVNYWADWCGPCRSEVPQLNALAEQLKGKGVAVVGVNFDGLHGDDLKKAAQELGIGFTVLADDPAPRFNLPQSEALPITYIIDAKGKVREQLVGEQTAAGISEKLAKLKSS
ncbi:TlpA disulfide reductase family protein [Pseudomonas eucalypticola]|uniref:TlpA family protein disulfide reductase n=1 Tax=Pseudomonas eucalypticola TaxID=2599595 RepID=A0A7D5HQV5_9PSED|nr:TlpA disulfide reductase family protein [Pseudomonas eucalypticola]QKZ06408.1 TlpA family protein disulfide reductase [Pseudomonas eucalypticola]